ncbi:MAG: hypothetical protein V3U57_03905 [Robiginitomaculum sp.]
MLDFLSDTPMLWGLYIGMVFTALFGIRAWLDYRVLEKDAAGDWDYRVTENMQNLRLTKDAYINIYKKVNAPRTALYLFIGGLAVIVLSPIVLAAGNAFLYLVWQVSGKSKVYQPGYLVWMFFLFFALIGLWVFIGARVSRHFHKHAPSTMRDEILRAQLDFHPERPLTIGANPVHIEAGEISTANYKTVFETVLGLSSSRDDDWNSTGHICDIYSDGSEMKICVHSAKGTKGFTAGTHPFFFAGNFAREDDKEKRYTLIFLIKNAYDALKRLEKFVPIYDKSRLNESTIFYKFSHKNLDFFLYETKEENGK